MPITLGSPAQPDFDQPIDLLMDCHRRVEHFLEVLCQVATQREGGPLDEEYRRALETALNYFLQAAPRHTADEEESLFPRMMASQDPRAQEVLQIINRLEADHAKAGPIHDRIDELGWQWLAEDRLSQNESAELIEITQSLRETYLEHIRFEDEVVFPAAAKALDATSLIAVGKEMKERRQVDPGRPGSRCAKRRQEQLGDTAAPSKGAKC